MSVDNRTMINDCEAGTGWVGDDAVTVVSDTGSFYEGTSSLSWQASNADERMATTEDSVNTGTFSLDWSDSTLYMVIKDNLQNTLANGGVQFVVGDGTDEIGYDVGGNDSTGVALATYFNAYRLDMSNRPAAFTVFAGVEANLTDTAITLIGYGCLHLAKANGPSDNVFMDAFRYIANGTAALTINGGTSGVPETMADVAADDVTNGWGMIGNPLGDQYQFGAPVEWGNSAATADAYFQADNEQWYLIGTGIGATHMDFAVVGNATDVTSWVVNDTVIVNIDTVVNWDFSDTDVDNIELTNVSFTDNGTFTFQAQDAGNKFMNFGGFNNCGQVAFVGMDTDGVTFNGTTDALGAVLLSTDPTEADNQLNTVFNSDGTGHAMEILLNTASLTTYTINGPEVDGYAGQSGTAGNRVFYVDNLLDGDVTINIVGGAATNVVGGGSGFSYEAAPGYTGTITVQQTVTLTVTVTDSNGDPVSGASARIENASTGALISQGTTNASGIYSDGTYNYGGDLSVRTKVRLKGYKPFRTLGTIISTGISVGVTLQTDNIVDLP